MRAVLVGVQRRLDPGREQVPDVDAELDRVHQPGGDDQAGLGLGQLRDLPDLPDQPGSDCCSS